MENNNERDYGQEDRNSQDQRSDSQGDSIQLGSSDNSSVGNDQNPTRTPENASDANAAGFSSGTNPDRYDSVSDGGAEASSTESYTETERYSAGNSDFDERKDPEENAAIPDSDDFDDSEEDDFDSSEEDDSQNPDEATRTPGL